MYTTLRRLRINGLAVREFYACSVGARAQSIVARGVDLGDRWRRL